MYFTLGLIKIREKIRVDMYGKYGYAFNTYICIFTKFFYLNLSDNAYKKELFLIVVTCHVTHGEYFSERSRRPRQETHDLLHRREHN